MGGGRRRSARGNGPARPSSPGGPGRPLRISEKQRRRRVSPGSLHSQRNSAMSDWLNPSAIFASTLGSFVAGAVLLASAPVWWKWIKPEDTAKLRKKGQTILGLVVVVGFFWGNFKLLDYFERSSIPRLHPTLTAKEAVLARSECEKESIATTADISPRYSRIAERRRYRAACLISKGFEFERD